VGAEITTCAIAILLVCRVCAAGDLPPKATFRTAGAKVQYEKALEYGDKQQWAAAVLELNRARASEPDHPAILIELGIAQGELKKWKEAAGALRRATEIAPGSARAHYNLALTLDRAQAGKALGIPEYRRALKLDPNHADALINLGADIGDRDPAEARTLFRRALTLKPNSASAHLNLGLLLKKTNQVEGATTEFREAARLDPGLLEAKRQLIPILGSQGKWGEVIETCRDLLSRIPQDASVRYTLGQALIRHDQAEEGKRELERAQELRKRQQAAEEAEKLRAAGITSLQKGNVADAMSRFTAAVALDDSSPSHMYLGLAHAAGGQIDQAISAMRDSIKIDPRNAEAHLNLGTMYLQKSEASQARDEIQRALELNPWLPQAHNDLGLVYSSGGDSRQALEHFRLASEMDPQYLEAWYNVGLACRSLNRLDEAISAFRRAAQLAPDNPQIQYALGMSLKDKGDSDGGKAALERAEALQRANK
jgi:tetratricopeptide (TPR) repeat protein